MRLLGQRITRSIAALALIGGFFGAATATLFASTTPTGVAAVTPHASATCSQPGGAFSIGSTVVGIAVTPDDGGYWIVNSAGQVAACGDAVYSANRAR